MHKFSHHHAERLERPERYSQLPPRDTHLRYGLKEGMSFADIGAGTGFFSRAASEIVGETGRVYAVDMSREMLKYLRKHSHSPIIQTVLSGEYSIPLPDSAADLTLLAFVVHETPDIPRFITEALRITRYGGTVVILEWKKQHEEHGPPMEERLDVHDLLAHLRHVRHESDSANDSHYCVVITK